MSAESAVPSSVSRQRPLPAPRVGRVCCPSAVTAATPPRSPCRQSLLSRQLAAEEARAAALRDISRRMFARFARHQAVWERAVQCLGLLDCLLALARFSRGCEVGCRPELVTGQEEVRRPPGDERLKGPVHL